MRRIKMPSLREGTQQETIWGMIVALIIGLIICGGMAFLGDAEENESKSVFTCHKPWYSDTTYCK
jgi:hypothetical protein